MRTDIQVQFGTDDGEKNYCQAIADLIRAEHHDLADQTLIAGLASLHVPLAELCLETRTNVVELTQWDTLQQMIFRPLDSGELCTAVGLDLSNYEKRRMTPEGVEPSVEVKFYSDESFPFSVKSRDEILAENASVSYSVPWHGCHEDFTTFVMTSSVWHGSTAPSNLIRLSAPPGRGRGRPCLRLRRQTTSRSGSRSGSSHCATTGR